MKIRLKSTKRSKGKTEIQRQLDAMVLRWVAGKAKESVKRGDDQAAESAFLSEVAADGDYSEYFPFLEPDRKRKVARR